jgi:hypothetical protein
MTQVLRWTWLSTEPRFAKTMKKTSVVVNTINGIQIWRNSHGMSRLVTKIDGRLYASSIHFLTIKEAEDAINSM